MSTPPKMRILIVDDNQSDRMVVRAMVFKFRPTFVHEAENGAVAESKLKTAIEISQPYHLVVLDWNMPNTNGLKLLQLVRAKAQFKSLKIIVMTGSAAREIVEAAIKNGADDFIVKPIDEDLLHQKIEKLTGWQLKPSAGTGTPAR
jgi:two-component system, chemotaxis family, chemotaxis protein CheY